MTSIRTRSPDRPPRAERPAREDRITQTYERLRELIVWGRLAPGSRVVESDVAERLGVSRTPVRSAFQRLQQEGYIQASDGGKQARLTVAPLTIQDANELFDMVGGIEGVAARRAAEVEPIARARFVAELVELNDALLLASERDRPDQNELFELDTAFHRCYVEAGAGARILALHDAVKPQAERYVRLYISALVGEISSSVREHEVIIQGIKRGDATAAQQAVLLNWENASRRLEEVMASMGERGSW